jgi:hypothetical protein
MTAATTKPERFIDATRTCWISARGLKTSRAVYATDYMGKIDANGKQPRGNDALTTIARSLPEVSVYFG